MNNFFSSIGALFTTLGNIGTEEYRGIKNTLIYLLVTFYLLCFLQLFFGSHQGVRLIGYVLCVGSMLLLFRVPRLIRIAGLGEILETFRLTQENPDNENDSIPDILENQLVSAVWNMTEKLFFLHSMSCLLIPVLPIKNNPEIIPIFTIAAVAVFLFIWRTGGNWVRPVGLTVSLLFLFIHLFLLFPQTEYYYTGLISGRQLVSTEEAEIANGLNDIRQKQRTEILNGVYAKAFDWQMQNPGRDLPEDIQIEIEATKKGVPLEEYKEQLKTEAETKTKEGKEKILIDTIRIDQAPFHRSFSGFLPVGNYIIEFQPENAGISGTLLVLLPNGEYKSKTIKSNVASVKEGEKGIGIGSNINSIARIYVQ